MTTTKSDTDQPLHVLVLDPSLNLGKQPGPTRTWTLCEDIARANFRITLFTRAPDTETSGKIYILKAGNTGRTPFGYPVPALANRSFARGLLRRLWRTTDVDAVVSTDESTSTLLVVLLFCKLRGAPLLIDARKGPPQNTHASTIWQHISIALKGYLYRRALSYARRVIVQNINLKENLINRGIEKAKIVEAPAGCDDQLSPSSAASTGGTDQNGKIDSRGPIMVYAGRLDSDTELETLVDITIELQSSLPGITFVVLGDGPGRKSLEAYAKRSGALNTCVRILDPVLRADLANVLAQATAVIGRVQKDTSWHPCGHVLDALAAERPVIFPGNNPYRDLVVGRGAGLALAQGDTKSAAQEIAEFVSDADGLRRARDQAAALASGRLSAHRIATTVRTAIESSVSEAPRESIQRRRMLSVKRAIDFTVSLTLLIILLPVIITLSIIIQIKTGSPIIFSQDRPGLKGKIFKLYKFRTMTTEVNSAGAALPDNERLTPLGKFLRRTSLDELPELFNVLRGDMSLVGPRPLLPEYLPYYSTEQKRRHDVLPGLTGWTQINGRNALTWEEKFELDVWYVENMNLALDFKIMMKTIWVALQGKGVNAPGYSTMPRFDEIMARREGAEDD